MSNARSRRSSSISALTRPTTFQLEKPNSALTPVYILNLNPHPQPFTSPLILQSPLPRFELFLHAQSTKGCNIFVTSSSAEKIARAIALGAKGGVGYTDEGGWAKKLQKMLPKGRPFLDAVIDGAGGDIVGTTWKLFKMGAAIELWDDRLGTAGLSHAGSYEER